MVEIVNNLTTRSEFKEHVKKHPVIIVKFEAGWCGPCQTIKPLVHQLMDSYNDIHYVVVDVDEGRDIASYLKIKTIPTLISYIDVDIHDILPTSNPGDIQKFFVKTNGYVK